MSRSPADLEGLPPNKGTTSKKLRRRQRIEDLLASCSTDVLKLERGAAREVAASEHAVRLLRARSSSGPASPAFIPAAPASSSSSAPPVPQPPRWQSVTGGPVVPVSPCAADGAGSLGDSGDLGMEEDAAASSLAAAPQMPASLRSAAEDRDRASAASIAAELFRVLAWDNTVLECNIRDYDTALNCTIEEVSRLRCEVRQLEGTCSQAGQLRDLLAREMRVRSRLRDQNAQLQERHHALLTAARQAVDISDSEGAALVEDFIAENSALRRLLSFAEAGSSQDGLAASARAGLLEGDISGRSTQNERTRRRRQVFDREGSSDTGTASASTDILTATLADDTADVCAEEIRVPN